MQLGHLWPHCSTAGGDPSGGVQRAAAPCEPAGLDILWGIVLWMGLGMSGCQGGSRSPLIFQAACCRGLTSSASPSSTRSPQNTSHLSAGAGQSAIPSLPALQTPLFHAHLWRQVCQLQGPVAGQHTVLQQGGGTGAASLRSNPHIKSLISEAGKGSFIPSRLKRQMGTCSSDPNWADWEVQLCQVHTEVRTLGLWRGWFLMIYYFTEDRALSSKCSFNTELQSF